MMLDESRAWLDLRASYGAAMLHQQTRLPVDDSLLGVVVRRKKPMQSQRPDLNRYQHVKLRGRKG